eukprot:gene11707-biopygen9383
MHLIAKDLWEIVQGTEVLRSGATADQQRIFRKRENIALATVCLSVDTSLQIYVRSATSSKEAWDNLQKHFEQKTLSQKIFYRRKLYSAKMAKGAKMIDHVNYLKTLAEHLEAVDDAIVEKDLVIISISSLPEEYNYLITALETIAEDKLTWDYVRDRLIHEFEKLHGEEQCGSGTTNVPDMKNKIEDNALFIKRGTDKGNPSNGRTFLCHYCKKPGHFARNRYKKKSDLKGKSGHASANIATTIAESKSKSLSNKIEIPQAEEIALTAGDVPTGKDNWWIDSGATQHMTSDKKQMTDYVAFKKPLQVRIADNTVLHAYGKGTISLLVHDGNEKLNMSLKSVLYVPKIRNKLLSLPSMTEKGVEVQFKGQSCKVVINDKVYNIGHKHGKLYKLNLEPETTCCYASTKATDDLSLWHNRFGHLGYDNLQMLSDKSMVDGIEHKGKTEMNKECESCAFGKQNRSPFPKKSSHRSTQPLELIHSDVCGPMNEHSVGGSKYFVTFIDDFSRFTTVYMMKNKSEVLQKFKEFVALNENLTGRRVKKLRADNGGEYKSDDFEKYCKERGILQEDTIPYTPQQNGVAERMNRTIMETVRSIMHHAKLPMMFWAEAVSTAVYIRNRCPTSALKEKTPYESWLKEKPSVKHLRVFGCNAMVHIPDEKRSKLDKKSRRCIFVGYPTGSKGYKLFDPETRKMIRSRDVIFMENSFGDDSLKKEDISYQLLPDDKGGEVTMETGHDNVEATNIEFRNQEHQEEREIELSQRQSQRVRQPPERYGIITGDWWNYASIAVSNHDEPRNIAEALQGSDATLWREALDSEYKSLMKNDTWKLVELPEGKNLVGSKWLFKIKHNADGSISRYKSRLVAQGYTEEAGEDYDEIFAPVAKYNSIRSVLAIANKFDMDIHQMDVKTAFLNGYLTNDIYMKQPEGYEDEERPHLVCKLQKSLYGLKQSARCWNITFDKYLKESGYVQNPADPCVYCKSDIKNGMKQLVIVAVYVDDMIIASNNGGLLSAEKVELKKRFEMDDLGEINYCLGMSIKRDRRNRVLTINQNMYLKNVLKRFQMQDCKPISTPMDPNAKFMKLTNDDEAADKREYQAMIGSLTYASIATRPDLSDAVGILSQFMSNPGQQHVKGVKRVLRYIQGTLDYGLRFEDGEFKLQGYSDADWAGDINTRKSTSGYVFRLGKATISWKSKRQPVVALSSTEAEYVALCAATQEAIWLRRLLGSLDINQDQATQLYEDNQGAIALSRNPNSHSRTKHIEIKYHYVRNVVDNKEIQLIYCPTEKMIADIMTKPLPRPKFEEMRSLIGVEQLL